MSRERGRREAASSSPIGQIWKQYRTWVAGMGRGQRIRYRILQTAVVLSVFIIIGFWALSAWIRVPEIPDFTGGGGNPGGSGTLPSREDSSQAGDGVSFDGAEVPDIVRSGRKEGIYTFLLCGKDVVSGSTDTMLLLSYDTKAKTIMGLNLPRDTMMNVSTTSKRLNAIYSNNRGRDKETQLENGMAALKKQVAKLTGITPDFYVMVEWEAIGSLVDALGGVEFEVPFDMNYDDPVQNLHIHQKAGLRTLTGRDAMEVIRHRKNNDGSHSNGDVGRLKIQQDFLKAVAKKCLQPATFLKVPELAKIFTENVETDLTIGNILAFAQLAYGMDPEKDVSFQTAPIASSFIYWRNGAAMVTLDGTGILEIVNNGMNPYLRDIRASDLQLVYRNSNGSFGVTNAALADANMGRVPPAAQPKPDPEPGEEDPEDPDPSGSGSQPGTEVPEGPDTGTEPNVPGDEEPGNDPGNGGEPGTGTEPPDTGGDTQAPGETDPPPLVTIDPSQVLPDPSSQDIPPTPEPDPGPPSQDIRAAA
ncbi:MAG: LCP family protein [Lawsonibacter sp.]|nr:LCP family protein [Lawsonibacter sp.]